ncbi:MAG: serine hydrolase [Bacteroidales bacterium]|nr:serine hydrolase [Bacteroidales bacterium]
MKKHKKLILFMAVAAAIAVVLNLSGRMREKGEKISDTEDIVPLNRLIDNSMSDTPHTKKFDAAIRRFIRQWDIKGGSFAIMRNDSLLYAKGYGFANLQDSTECDVKHIFRVASVSKLITAVAIMRLNETGALSVDDNLF